MYSLGEVDPRVYEAIPRGVKELLAVTSCFSGRDCTDTLSAPNLHPFRLPHVTSHQCLYTANSRVCLV